MKVHLCEPPLFLGYSLDFLFCKAFVRGSSGDTKLSLHLRVCVFFPLFSLLLPLSIVHWPHLSTLLIP